MVYLSMSTSMFSITISITQYCTCPGPGIHVLKQNIDYPCITYSCIRDI